MTNNNGIWKNPYQHPKMFKNENREGRDIKRRSTLMTNENKQTRQTRTNRVKIANLSQNLLHFLIFSSNPYQNSAEMNKTKQTFF